MIFGEDLRREEGPKMVARRGVQICIERANTGGLWPKVYIGALSSSLNAKWGARIRALSWLYYC